MPHSTIETTDAAVLAQFLRECEPPTPPCSTLQFRSYEFTQELLQPYSSVFELDEEDKRTLLAALDGYSEMNNSSVSNGIQRLENHGEMDKAAMVSTEETKALKLKIQRAKATKRRNRHRQRVKEEWETLRLQNSQLSAKLEELKRVRVGGGIAVEQLKWQTLAAKELTARQQAEGQQQRIRMAIERRSVVMQTLQEAFDAQSSVKKEEDSPEWTADDFKLYENFTVELKAAYAQTDAVLEDCGLAGATPSNTSFYKPIRRRDAVRDISFFESTSSFAMPSKYPDSANAMFDAIREVQRQNPRRKLIEAAEDPHNTIAVKFGTVYHYEEDKIYPLNLITVQRRFVEADRTVLVWRCLIEGEGDFAGTFLDETGWCVLRPTSTGAVNSTDVRTCIHSVPTHSDACAEQLVKMEESDEAFANAVVRSSEQDSLKLACLMEQLLLGA